MTPDLYQVVDTERYPLQAPDSDAWNDAVARARQSLQASGCCVLPGFVRPEAVETLRAQCAEVAPLAYYDVETVNVYNTAPDPSLPADHPARVTTERGNAFVARDAIPPDSIIASLYSDPYVQAFVAGCFGIPEVHELADPLAGLCLNVLTPGREHPWHFDTNEFAVSMLTQAPEGGGSFDYCAGIRSAESENLADVAAVLAGGGGHLVRSLVLLPGDLQLFRGRYALHRVSAVQGRTDRHSAIFAYTEKPGVIGTVARTRQLFGRVLPAHLSADRAGRVDQLLD